jgi:hypothetical protein
MSPKAEHRKSKLDETLRRMLNTPPDHKARTKTGAPKKEGPNNKPSD